MENSQPFFHSGGAGLTLSNFSIRYFNDDVVPAALLSLAGIILEDLSGLMDAGWYRLTGLSESTAPRTLLVAEALVSDVPILRQSWPDTTLTALFIGAPGNIPVTVLLTDEDTAAPISGVSVSVWDATSTTVVVPLLVSGNAGKVVTALPPGSYRVYLYKPFAVFVDLPVVVDVVATPVTVSVTGKDGLPPVQPSFQQVTVYGHVLRPNTTPYAGVEVKLRLQNTPQMGQTASFSRAAISVVTDEDGYFEIRSVGSLYISLECDATGYSRVGKLPVSGALNWKDFSVASI